MPDPSIVLFVCQHGALRSRLAEAFFNACAPSGWQARSAGIEPQDAVSVHAAILTTGTAAQETLDHSRPVAVTAVPDATLIIAVDCELAGARTWQLSTPETDSAMRDELRDKVETLTAELTGAPD